jgi:CelD/BcsL family acetyltransferase involved in cellulose biosynthesis
MNSILATVRPNDGKAPYEGAGEPPGASERTVAAVSNAVIEYSIVTTRAGFNKLGKDWDALFARAGKGAQAFQTFGWCRHWCDHYYDDDASGASLAIVTGWRDGRLVLVWPLVVSRSAGFVRLWTMGEPATQYCDALVEASPDTTKQLRRAWDHVIASVQPDLAWFPRVRDDAVIAPLMQALGGVAVKRAKAPFVDLSDTPDFDTYMSRRSNQARKRRRAQERREEASKIEVDAPEPGAFASQLAAMTVEMKRAQLGERGVISPAFSDGRLEGFFADAARSGDEASVAQMITLKFRGEYAAANILVRCKDQMLGHVFTYDPRFAKDSFGSSLLYRSIMLAIEQGCRTLDLLSPADEYKMRHADGAVDVISWAVPLTAKGRAYTHVYLERVVPFLKAAVAMTPARLRGLIAQRYYRRGKGV